MERLSNREWEYILQSLYRINTAQSYEEFAHNFFEQLRRIIPYSKANMFLLEANGENYRRVKPQCYPSKDEFHQLDKFLADSERGSNYNIFAPWSVAYRQTDIETVEQIKSSYAYKNFWAGDNLMYALQITLVYKNAPLASISVFRDEGDVDFSNKELFIVETLKNHLALKLHQIVDEPESQRISLEQHEDVLTIPNKYNLTNREKEIVQKLYDNSDRKAICQQLCISEYTLRKHICNIYSKLGVQSYAQLLLWIKNNLL